MAQTKTQIQEILTRADASPRHRWGQNFMIDQNLIRVIASAGQIDSNDTVIEVGPGTGTLTEELAGSPAKKVIAVEIDQKLAELLRERFLGEPRFELIVGDALSSKHELNEELKGAIGKSERVKLVANLPYNIASPLVIDLLIAGVELLAFTVQKEVAQRLAARAGSDEYGPISVMAQQLSDVEILRTLPRQAFWPMPKIESALVRMVRRDQLGKRAAEFGRFVSKIFSSRRKTLRKAMTIGGFDEKALQRIDVDGSKRAEEFAPGELMKIFDAMGKVNGY